MGPTGNKVRVPRKPVEEPEAESVPSSPNMPDVEKELSELEAEIQKEQEKSPKILTSEELHEQYLEGLDQVGLDLVGARAIMESVLIKGFYEESFRIGPLTAKLRTRSYADTLRAQRYLETESPTYHANVNDLVARYNVAASLAQWGDNIFAHPEDNPDHDDALIESEFNKRLRFVLGRPAIVTAKLMELVYKFDLKVAAVFAEGAPQDF
jgi:hypothetical protein